MVSDNWQMAPMDTDIEDLEPDAPTDERCENCGSPMESAFVDDTEILVCPSCDTLPVQTEVSQPLQEGVGEESEDRRSAWSAAPRRRHYRVSASTTQGVETMLLWDAPATKFRRKKKTTGRRGAKVDIVDVSIGGAQVRIANEETISRATGREVWVKFTTNSGSPVEMAGEIMYVRESGTRHKTIGVAFHDWVKRKDKIDTCLRRLFNERQAFRVPNRRDETVRVFLYSPGDPITEETTDDEELVGRPKLPLSVMGKLRDISTLGIGGWTTPHEANGVDIGRQVSARFTLPLGESDPDDQEPEPLCIEAEVRYIEKRNTRGRVCIGLKFIHPREWSLTTRRAVVHYVMQRQLEMIRRIETRQTQPK